MYMGSNAHVAPIMYNRKKEYSNVKDENVVVLQEVDFGAGTFSITEDRFEVVDFTTSMWEASTTFIVKLPDKDILTMYLQPFKVECPACM